RIGFAFAADAKDREKDRLFARIIGKADQKRIVEAFKNLNKGGREVWKEIKDAKGTPITTMVEPFGPAIAFIGDTDLVVAGYAGGKRMKGAEPPNHKEVLDQVLAVRAGKEATILKGDLKDRLSKISKDTVGLLVGDVPEDLRRGLFGGQAPAPKSVRFE